MEKSQPYADLMVVGTCAGLPLLAMVWWWLWGRKAKRPDLAAENAGAILALVGLLLLGIFLIASAQQWLFWCLVGVNILKPILYLNRIPVVLAVLGLVLTVSWWRGRGRRSGDREESVENVVMAWVFLGVTLFVVMAMLLTLYGFGSVFWQDFSPG